MKVSLKQDVLQMYDQTAAAYAQMMDQEIDLPMYSDVLARLAKRIAKISGPVIDTSCGSGHMLQRYRERYDKDRALIGIDISPKMVEIAAATLVSQARVHAGDMCDLSPFGDQSAAAVLSYFSIHHLEPAIAQKAFLEWWRVLVPGGQVVVASWEGTGPIDYGDANQLVALRYTQAEISAWAESAGFRVDRCLTEPVEDMDMSAVYLEGTCLRP